MYQTRKLEPDLKENARFLRRELSPAEKILWKSLRGRRFARFKFRRQHPIGAYIVDFVCLEVGLAIELDGESHLPRAAEDHRRDRWLESQGIKIVRFWNTEMYDDNETVMEKIWIECTKRRAAIQTRVVGQPLTPGPSPQGGEGGK